MIEVDPFWVDICRTPVPATPRPWCTRWPWSSPKPAGRLKAVSTENGSEFQSQEFRQAVAKTGAQLRFIHAGRPQSNGCVERVQRTVLEECWRPSFARSMIPKYTALRRDLVQYPVTG